MATFQPYKDYKPVDLNFTKQIPSDWIVKRGKFLFREVSERSKKGEEQLLSVSEHKGIVPRDSINVTMFQALSYEGYKLCNKGDIVVNSLWAWHRGLGVSEYHGIVSTAYGVYRPIKPEQWNHRYLNYLLRDRTYVGECLIRSKGIWESRYQLTGSNFLDIPILQPSLEVQNQIVAYLDRKTAAIDKFIRNKERLIELLEEEKEKFISSAISQGINENISKKQLDEDWLKEIPSHWNFKPLKYFVRTNQFALTEKTNPNYEIQYVDIGNVTFKGLVNEPEKLLFKNAPSRARRIVKAGDTILSTVRTYLKAIAFFEICDANLIASTGFAVLSPRKNVNPRYLKYLLSSSYFINKVSFGAVGVNYPGINNDRLLSIKIAVPPTLNEQEEIINEIEGKISIIDDAISKAHKEIEAIKEYREALITNAVTGRIVVSG